MAKGPGAEGYHQNSPWPGGGQEAATVAFHPLRAPSFTCSACWSSLQDPFQLKAKMP